jgi:hypothetical protein
VKRWEKWLRWVDKILRERERATVLMEIIAFREKSVQKIKNEGEKVDESVDNCYQREPV